MCCAATSPSATRFLMHPQPLPRMYPGKCLLSKGIKQHLSIKYNTINYYFSTAGSLHQPNTPFWDSVRIPAGSKLIHKTCYVLYTKWQWNALEAWAYLSNIPQDTLHPDWCFSILHPHYLVLHHALHISFTNRFLFYISFIIVMLWAWLEFVCTSSI